MGDFGDVWHAPQGNSSEPDEDTLAWAHQVSREVQAAYAGRPYQRLRSGARYYPKAPQPAAPAAAPDPDAWLAEYQRVMAEDLSLSGKTLDRLAPYAPDPAKDAELAAKIRAVSALLPPAVRARRKSPDARIITLPRAALISMIILTVAFVTVVIGVMRLTGVLP